jgi:hypothetical protein
MSTNFILAFLNLCKTSGHICFSYRLEEYQITYGGTLLKMLLTYSAVANKLTFCWITLFKKVFREIFWTLSD